MAEPIQTKVTARHRPHNMLFNNHTIHRLTTVFNDFGEAEIYLATTKKSRPTKISNSLSFWDEPKVAMHRFTLTVFSAVKALSPEGKLTMDNLPLGMIFLTEQVRLIRQIFSSESGIIRKLEGDKHTILAHDGEQFSTVDPSTTLSYPWGESGKFLIQSVCSFKKQIRISLPLVSIPERSFHHQTCHENNTAELKA